MNTGVTKNKLRLTICQFVPNIQIILSAASSSQV
jgi:hypothetical protein